MPSLQKHLLRKLALGLLLTPLIAPWSAAAHADAAGAVCESLRTTRIHLIAAMGATNAMTRDNHIRRIHAASDTLDARLAAMRQGGDSRNAARAAEFEPVWDAFKHTRETEIIPAVHAARTEHARSVALGIQAERMKAMNTLMDCAR